MKKILSVILIAVMMLSLAACASSNEETTTKAPEQTTESTTPAPEQTTEPTTEEATTEEVTTEEVTTEAVTEETTTEEAKKEEVTTAPEATEGLDPLAILEKVWGAHGDDEKFAIMGGDYNTMIMDAPGAFGVEDAEALNALLALPADQAGSIDSAASIIHMMNANTFTCGAFAVKADADVATVAQALHDSIAARQWMCGFPDKMVIMTIDNVIISMFGNEMAIDNFKAHVTDLYSNAVVSFDEAIM